MSRHKTPRLSARNWEALLDADIAHDESRDELRRTADGMEHSKVEGKARRARQQFYRSRWG